MFVRPKVCFCNVPPLPPYMHNCILNPALAAYSGLIALPPWVLAADMLCCPCATDIACEGAWSSCGSDCADKTYSVTTPASGNGAACEAVDGATAACAAGEGDCPAGVFCHVPPLPPYIYNCILLPALSAYSGLIALPPWCWQLT